MEKALYALNWSIPHVGPFAEAAIDTVFATLWRLGAVEGAPQVLRTILDRYGYRPGVCEGAKSLLDVLYLGAEGKSWTYRAYLAEAFAQAAATCGLEEAARVAEKLLGELGGEERLLASGAYYSLARWLGARGELDEAERYAELLGKAADGLAGAARGKAAQHLKWR
ncbi:MAG: hypothetical protein QXP98_00490 [Thermoproteus sp.]